MGFWGERRVPAVGEADGGGEGGHGAARPSQGERREREEAGGRAHRLLRERPWGGQVHHRGA